MLVRTCPSVSRLFTPFSTIRNQETGFAWQTPPHTASLSITQYEPETCHTPLEALDKPLIRAKVCRQIHVASNPSDASLFAERCLEPHQENQIGRAHVLNSS